LNLPLFEPIPSNLALLKTIGGGLESAASALLPASLTSDDTTSAQQRL